MTNEQIDRITYLQQSRKGYRTIAAELDLPVNSVKSWCRRHPINGLERGRCQQCGAPLNQIIGKRTRRFCSDACRLLWWKEHPEKKSHRIAYRHVCRFCGAEFINNRAAASYCNRACFARARARESSNG